MEASFELSDVLEVLQVYHGKKKAEELGPLFLEEVKKYQKKPNQIDAKILYSFLVFEIWIRVFHIGIDPKNISL